MSLASFDVVVVPFPYTDVLGEKRRPAVVVSAPEMEERERRLWLAMVTSAPGPMQYGDVHIEDLVAAGLGRRCRVRIGKLATLDIARIVRRTGSLGAGDRERARLALAACAGW